MPSRSKYICRTDPALDITAERFDWAEFWRTGDLACLPIKAGHRPVIFTLERLGMLAYDHALAAPTGTGKMINTVALGLRHIEGHPDGLLATLKLIKVPDVGERVNQEQLERLFKPSLFAELGERILALSELDPLPPPA
jgi:hypothetical protein